MKTFVWTFIVVVVGIYVYNRLTGATASPGGTISFGPLSISPAQSNTFAGPDIDPKTGGYLPPGAQPGTVAFPVQTVS